MTVRESSKKVNKNELLDLLENTGILQEANRTFFHPIGLNLKLEKDLTLSLEITEDEHGFILHTVDKFKINAFNHYRMERHKKRQARAGFIIQTRDMIRSDKLETSIVAPSVLKLNLLLTELDNFAFDIKKRLMEKSPEKDKDLKDLDIEELIYYMHLDFQKGNYIDGAARATLVERIEPINKRLKDIRKLEKEQKEVYKEK
jgi:hypothetical protein